MRGVLGRLKNHYNRFRQGLRPDLAGAAHDAPADPTVGWGWEYPSHPLLLDAYGISVP